MPRKVQQHDKQQIKSWSQLIDEMGKKKNGNGVSYREQLVKELYKRAMTESWAMRELLDRTMGKPMQLSRQDITSNGQSLNATVNFVDTSAHILDSSKQSGQLVQNVDSVKKVDSNMPICEYSNMPILEYADEGKVDGPEAEAEADGDAQPLEKNGSDNCDTTTPKISPNQLDTSKETE
jgi:hypothetical protein